MSWPRYGEDGQDERTSPILRPRSERRPSRLSLMLASGNPATDMTFVVREEDDDDGDDQGEAEEGSKKPGSGEGEVGVEEVGPSDTPPAVLRD